MRERRSEERPSRERQSPAKPGLTKSGGFLAGITYTSIALAIAGLFLAVTLLGRYTLVARLGGTAWVFILAIIILMPPVISHYKRKRP